MTKTYEKRIQSRPTPDGAPVHLYVNVVDSTPVSYFITFKRKRIAFFAGKDAALTRFHALTRGVVEVALQKERNRFVDQAEEIIANPGRFVGEVPLPTLAAMARIAAEKKRLSLTMLQLCSTAGGNSGRPIPTDDSGFAQWLEEEMKRLFKGTTSKRTLHQRANFFLRVFRVVLDYSVSLRKYIRFVEVVKARVEREKSVRGRQVRPIKNRPAMSRLEIQRSIDSVESFEEVCLLLAYLTGGFRAKEAERLTQKTIGHDYRLRLQDSGVVTKTSVNRRPPASIALRAILAFVGSFEANLTRCDRKLFRPTCATYLALAGVSAVEIAERLNHASMAMVIEKYTKYSPEDMQPGQTVEQYLGIGPLIVGGQKIEENAWDRWVLKTALEQAKRFGVLQEFRDRVLACLEGHRSELAC